MPRIGEGLSRSSRVTALCTSGCITVTAAALRAASTTSLEQGMCDLPTKAARANLNLLDRIYGQDSSQEKNRNRERPDGEGDQGLADASRIKDADYEEI